MNKLLFVATIIFAAILAILAIVYLPAEATVDVCGPKPTCEEGEITVKESVKVPKECHDDICIPEHWTAPICRDPITGCMDELAYNFNQDAEVDDDSCVYDVCPNIEGLQEVVPEGKIKLDNGKCVTPIKPDDYCQNMEGLQQDPNEYIREEADGGGYNCFARCEYDPEIRADNEELCVPPSRPTPVPTKEKKTCDSVLRMWLLWDQFGRECYIISDTHPGVDSQQRLCKWDCDDRPFVAIRAWSGVVDSCDVWELDEYARYPRLGVDDLKKIRDHTFQYSETGGGEEFCPVGG